MLFINKNEDPKIFFNHFFSRLENEDEKKRNWHEVLNRYKMCRCSVLSCSSPNRMNRVILRFLYIRQI